MLRPWTDNEFRALVEAAPDAMVAMDEYGVITLVNDQTERLFGYQRSELLGKPVEELIPERYRAAHIHHRRTYGESPRLRPMGAGRELYGVRKDGSEFPVEVSLSPVRSPAGTIVFSAIRDVTDRKQAEATLRRSEAYLAEAQRLTCTGSWAWDSRQDKMLHCSEEIFRIYGLEPEDGLPSYEMLSQRIHPEDRDRVTESTLEGVRLKEERLLEYRIVLPDGTLKHIESVRRPVLDAAGNVCEVVATSIDVTKRKRDEEERERLRKLEADLAHVKRVSMLGELTASLTHEIKQPIAGILTSAIACRQWLAHDPPDLERARAAVTRVERDGARAATFIDRLRPFYRKDSSDKPELVDVNMVIREIGALLRDEVTQRSVAIRLELADSLPKVMADRVQLQQVVMNLMLNAIEAMKDTAGTMTVRSELGPDGQLLISVSDTGVGIPAESAERLFDSFFTTKSHGMGMGLTITRSLIESHGGRVWAAANEDSGATFYFTLPALPEAQA